MHHLPTTADTEIAAELAIARSVARKRVVAVAKMRNTAAVKRAEVRRYGRKTGVGGDVVLRMYLSIFCRITRGN